MQVEGYIVWNTNVSDEYSSFIFQDINSTIVILTKNFFIISSIKLISLINGMAYCLRTLWSCARFKPFNIIWRTAFLSRHCVNLMNRWSKGSLTNEYVEYVIFKTSKNIFFKEFIYLLRRHVISYKNNKNTIYQ